MTLRMAAAFILLLGVGGFGLAANLTGFAMVDAVNEKLPEDQRFQHLGWYFTKTQRLHREYRRLYPIGTLLRRQGVLAMAMLVCLVFATSLLGFSLPVVTVFGGASALTLYQTYIRG